MSDAELAVEIRAAADQVAAACANAEREGRAVQVAVDGANEVDMSRVVRISATCDDAPPHEVRAAIDRLNADLAEAAGRKIRVRLATPQRGMVVVQEMWRAT